MSTEFPTPEDFAGEQFFRIPGFGDLSGVPDESLIQELANQFFKAPPVPQPTQSNIGAVPSSIAGSGISPSAVNQGNAVDLKDPQTSLPDPHFAGTGHVPSSVAGSGASPSAASYKGPQHNNAVPPSASGPFYFINDKNPFHQQRESHPSDPWRPSDLGARPASALPAPPFDVNQVRRDFPILHQHVGGRPLVWLDNAATTQKPRSVIERIAHYYRHDNSNIHRAAHELAARSTDAYEGAREKVQHFLNAASPNEIVFVRGATEAINLVAKSWGQQFLQPNDEIIISHLEHHANIVPWQQLAATKNLKLKIIPVDDDGQLRLDEYSKLLTGKTKLVSFTQVSNALGTITPAKTIVEMAHAAGAKALVDGAQAVSHMPVDVRALDADWYAFSGHKVFGPTGIGVLYAKEDLLNATDPWQGGGNMIKDVTFEHTTYQQAPAKFEAGTGNIADAIGLGAAIDYVTAIGMPLIAQYEHYLLQYATRLLNDIPGLHIIGTAPDKAGVLSFVLDGYRTEQVGATLNSGGIAVRSGHHCAQPILRRFGQESTVRPSLALYNTCADIDALISVLHRLASNRPR
ncbi:MAG TPA: family 2A encapsulin nanocompartment cargo protein cysteine desulfurase [Puia sp.]|nr:family 2A encapsulin nanocompartment cargo protein cysteine desulfurase [Puia sp.]